MLHDLRLAARRVLHERRFAVAVTAILALGIGINAFGFSVIYAVYFRPLPFANQDRLRMIAWETAPNRHTDPSYDEFQAWRSADRAFDDLAAFRNSTVRVSDGRGYAQEALATAVTANAFALLGLQPARGRPFAPDDERTGRAAVVVLSHDLWRARYAADPHIVGQTLRVDGVPATIVGVMPERVRFPENTQIWTVLRPPREVEQRRTIDVAVFGRLRAAMPPSVAQAELQDIARRNALTFRRIQDDGPRATVQTFRESFIGGVAPSLFASIMATASLVLLIACANVANLLLSRAASRTREIALRFAVGASRWRVVRQLVLESLVLGVLGAIPGLLVAAVIIRLFGNAMQSTALPYWISFTLDSSVVAYVMALCLVTAVLFGLAPAIHAALASHSGALKEGARGLTGGRRSRRFSSVLVVAELTLTLVVLLGAGLMVRSLFKLYVVDVGVRTSDLMAMPVSLSEESYDSPTMRRVFFERIAERLAVLGISRVAVTTGVPPLDGGERLLEVEGMPGRPRFVSTVTISPRFFDVAERRILRGRAFDEGDGAPGLETVLINQELATAFFGSTDPVGRRIRFTTRQPTSQQQPVWHTIVGIAPPIRHGDPSDEYRNAVVYLPYREEAPRQAWLLIRSSQPPIAVENVVRREVQAIDEDQPVGRAKSVEDLMAEGRGFHRLVGALFGALALVALVLSAAGLYAVTASSVAQRRQELAVRMAVGARGRDILWLIVRSGVRQLAVGTVLGIAGGIALGMVLRRMLVATEPVDPATFAIVLAVLTAVSLSACIVPARRAAGMAPLAALRAD